MTAATAGGGKNGAAGRLARVLRWEGVPRLALYRDDSMRPHPRSEVVVEADRLSVVGPDGRERRFHLHGSTTLVVDAAASRRFVRMLIVERAGERATLITPPERGAIAPRAVRLPEAPGDAYVVEAEHWEPLVAWLAGGGRLAGCSVGELAQLTTIASPHFAILLGEVLAAAAMELVWEATGPWRGGIDLEHALRPLVDLARRSPRAADALVAALAAVAGARAGRAGAGHR